MTQTDEPGLDSIGAAEHRGAARPASVPSALSVLELLGERGVRPLAELSRELGLPKSTLRRSTPRRGSSSRPEFGKLVVVT